MSNFAILDLVIGMTFIFFLLSIITSSAVEVVLTLSKLRAKILAKWLRTIFDKPALLPDGNPNVTTINGTPVLLGQAIMDHCMLTVLSGSNSSTTYIKSSDFVASFLDQVTRTPTALTNSAIRSTQQDFVPPPKTLEEYRAAVESTPVLSRELKRTIIAFINEAESAIQEHTSKIDLFKEKIENWYDSNADRLTGRLKRRWALPLTALMATLVTLGLNADTAAISSYLYDHKEISRQFSDKALTTINNYKEQADRIGSHTLGDQQVDARQVQEAIRKLGTDIKDIQKELPAGLPIGWDSEKWDNTAFKKMSIADRVGYGGFWKEIIDRHWLGWLATILAILLGAPFWFDMLNKVANIRGAGPKPASSIDEKRK